jgi:hypothetical protein
MNYITDAPPPRNYFNAFAKGKSYFYARAALEGMLIIALFAGCIQLAGYAMAIYPTVVRDGDYRVAMGKAQEYKATINEVVTFSQDVLEGLYTRTERGSAKKVLAPYVAPNILRQKMEMRPSNMGFIQSASLTGFFITNQDPRGVTAYAELTVTQTNGSNIMTETLYFNLAVEHTPISPSNDKGWRLIGLKDSARDVFLKQQRIALQEDSEPDVNQGLLDF